MKTFGSFVSRITVMSLRFAGVWPVETPRRRYHYQRYVSRVHTTLVLAAAVYLLCNLAASFVLTVNDKELFFKDLWLKVGLVIINFQIILFFIKRDSFTKLLNSTPIVVSNSIILSLKIYHRQAIIGYNQILISTMIIAVTVLASESLNFAVFEEFLPHSMFYKPLKLLVYMFQIIFGGILLFFHIGLSSLYFYRLLFIRGYLHHLTHAVDTIRLRKQNRRCRQGRWPSRVNRNFHDIRYCVTMHRFVIRLVRETNDVFSLPMLLKLWQSLLDLCLTAFEFKAKTQHRSSWSYLTYTTVLFLIPAELFACCWLGEIITFRSVKLSESCAAKMWRGRHSRMCGDRQSLVVMAARCRVPLELTAGPFYRVNLETFTALLAMAFSYFMFLTKVKL